MSSIVVCIWMSLLIFLAICAFTDAKGQVILNRVVLLGIIAAVVIHGALQELYGLQEALTGGAVGMAVGITGDLLSLVRMRLWSMGDAKLIAMTGAFLGWKGAILAALCGMTVFVIEGFVRMALKKPNKSFPFGPSFALGTVVLFIAQFVGIQLLMTT